METQKTQNSQSNLEKQNKKKEMEESGPKVKLYTTKLQSSRQYGTGRKTEIQTNGTG